MSVLSAGFAGTVQWVLQHGYSLLFVLMLIEGPVVTAAGAFAAALHYFNIWIILLLSILANLIPDLVYYALGYWGRQQLVNRYGHYFGLTPERIALIEKLAEEHSGKSLFMIKMVPLLATPGLIFVGTTRMNIRKFAWWCTIITIPTSVLYLVLGYYFGAAYESIDRYLHVGGYVAAAAIVVTIIVVWVQRKYFSKLFSKELDEH